MSISKFLEVIDFLRVGVSTNFWGLGCPFYCGSPAWISLGLTLFLGFLAGIFATTFGLLAILYHCGFVHLPASQRPSPAPSRGPSSDSRLRGYLHEL